MFRLLFSICILSFNSVFASHNVVEEDPQDHVIQLSHKFLNPAKGWTVWMQAPILETFTWLSYGLQDRKTHQESLASGYEITVTDYSHVFDYGSILHGINMWNEEKLMNSIDWDIKLPGIKGSVCWDLMELRIKNVNFFQEELAFIEQEAYINGVRHSFVELDNYPQDTRVSGQRMTEEAANILFKSGYRLLKESVCQNLMTGSFDSLFYKKLKSYENNPSSNCFEIQWKKDRSPHLLEMLPFFGVYLRNEDGHALGGIWGALCPKAAIPHAYVYAFFMDSLVKGNGYGKLVMGESEKFVRSRSLDKILLGTCDHQAPWFYEKVGFKKIKTHTNTGVLSNGKRGNEYSYLKDL